MKLLRFIAPTVALIVALLAGLSGLAAAGQRLTSLRYSLTTINPPPLDHVTAILDANGFEYVDE
jgi:hypothetical protein